MAQLYRELKPKSKYYDKQNFSSKAEYEKALEISSTVYVGNLSFYSSEDSVWELFSRCGDVEDVKMGISDTGTPCGFCFVMQHNSNISFKDHESARRAVEYLSGTKLGERIIRVDWDPGYKEGREKGRGSGGIQKRDEFRNYQDSDRPVKKPTGDQGRNTGNRSYREGYKEERFRGRGGGGSYSRPRRYEDGGDRGERGDRDRDRNNDRGEY